MASIRTNPLPIADSQYASPSLLQPAAFTNLLSNPSFETGTFSGWTEIKAGASISTAAAHDGTYSARLQDTEIRQYVGSTVIGKEYKATVWIKLESEYTSGSDAWGGFRVQVQDGNWNGLAHSGYLSLSTYGTDWFEVGLNFTATTTTTRLFVGKFGGKDRHVTGYVDDAAMFEKTGENIPPVISGISVSSLTSLSQMQNFSVSADDLDGSVKQIVWDFGDGVRSFLSAGSRKVTNTGTFTASVKVIDDNGGVSTSSVSWTASDSAYTTISLNSTPLIVNSSTISLGGTIGQSGRPVKVTSDRDQTISATVNGTAWSADFPLLPGNNRIIAQVTNSAGKITAIERVVRYEPSGALSITNVAADSAVQRWDSLDITFQLNNSAATNPDFPYYATPAAGLDFVDGTTVDAIFWRSADPTKLYRRPAFRYQDYNRQLKSDKEWLYPVGAPVWTARFAPPELGTWYYYIEVTEAKGTAQSAVQAFAATVPTDPNNHGPVELSPTDSRYFRYADGTTFLGNGHSIGTNNARNSYDAIGQFAEMGTGNQELLRTWLGGDIWASAWTSWNSRTAGYDGNVPNTQLSVDSAYGDGLAAGKLDVNNPILFQGWMSAYTPTIPGKTYKMSIRWRTVGVSGPYHSGSSYGAVVKFTGWPTAPSTSDPAPINNGTVVIPFETGDSPWHVSEGQFTASGDFVSNFISIMLENASAGEVYVDSITVREVLAGGSLGENLVYDPNFNSHLRFDPAYAYSWDQVVEAAQAQNIHLKFVVSEKAEYLLNHLSNDGTPQPAGGNFSGSSTSPNNALHKAYWRYLAARYGAYRAIHSWEYVNEDDPNSGTNYRMAQELSRFSQADGNPHLGNTSTWSGLNDSKWTDPQYADISYADFHAYIRGTGFESNFTTIDPGVTEDILANDSARAFNDYDRFVLSKNIGKPVVWGEMGIDGSEGTDGEDPGISNDTAGVWLKKMVWARSGPGGVIPLYWYTSNIYGKDLSYIYGTWNKFMAGIPLDNGRYVDVAASSSNSNIRAMGQKDTTAGWAHVWIDNKYNTWKNVVDGASMPAQSGSITINMGRANQVYTLKWYNTSTGLVSSTTTVTANSSGVVTLSVSSLSTDKAARLEMQQLQSAAPGTPDLSSATDTGLSVTDNLTNRNNSSGGASLQFIVSGTVSGATVTIFADGAAIGSAVAAGSSTTVTTSGSFTLSDGSHVITARQTEPGKTQSNASPGLTIQIDTIAPTASFAAISPNPRTSPVTSMNIGFTESVSSFDLADLSLIRDGLVETLVGVSINALDSYNWSISGLSGVTDRLGNFTLILSASGSGIVDAAGNALAANATRTWTMTGINGTANSDFIRIARAADPTWATITVNGVGYDAAMFSLASVLISAGDGVADTLELVGNASAESIGLAGNVLSFGGMSLTLDSIEAVEMAGAGAGDAITVTNGSLTFTSTQQVASLTIGDGGSVVVASGGDKVLVTESLGITGTGQLDLADNDMVVGTAAVSNVLAFIRDGRVVTSLAVSGERGLGYSAGGDDALYKPDGKFSGQTIDDDSVVVKYTYFGDADLDGDVDASDVAKWALNFTGELSGGPTATNLWTQGDWDYDGDIDASDVAKWALNFTGELSGTGLTEQPQAIEVAEPIEIASAQAQAAESETAAMPVTNDEPIVDTEPEAVPVAAVDTVASVSVAAAKRQTRFSRIRIQLAVGYPGAQQDGEDVLETGRDVLGRATTKLWARKSKWGR